MDIDKIMKEMNTEYFNAKMIHNEVYCVEANNEKYIVKINAPSLLRRIINNLNRAKDIAFQNEIWFYKRISEKSFKHFRYPRMIRTDGKRYIVLECISGTDGWNKTIVSQQHLISALLEFQFSGIVIEESFTKRTLTKWYRKVPCKAIRWAYKLIKTPADLITWLKCILIVMKGIIAVKKITYPICNHNDLFYFNNLITGNDGNLYFYDFEYVIAEDKWFLTDIFDLSFNLETLELQSELLCEYIRQVACKTGDLNILRYMESQTRVILIRKLLGVILSRRRKEANKDNCRNFIINILLSDKEYKQWYTKNIESICF
ncbi:MAG: hypothetical protein GX796_11940 [Clostridiaceae bacterium]|jgi:hypothetical protein|nr:hypothetical protein [Clostridiaceae bacterium]